MITMRNLPRVLLGAVLAGTALPSFAQPDYSGALWNQANTGNFTVSNRTTTYPILYVVCHIMEGTYAGSISWFKNAASNVSAHYLIRSSDGQITQMVREKDIAYHAGVWTYNTQSIGIEHEAFSNQPQWYTSTLYQSSARLTRYLTSKYGIARDRTKIIGHKETGAATSCPGPNWDWNIYMPLVQNNATFVDSTVPGYISAGQNFDVVMRFVNAGTDAWTQSSSDPVQLGTASASPYFVSGNWLSSTRAAGVFADTPAGGTAEFKFQMKAPTTLGSYSQVFQLYRSSIEAFGPTVTLNFNVGTVDTVLDNTSPNFTATGSWATGTTAPGKYGANYLFSTVTKKTSAVANWFLNVPTSGSYDVYGWWPEGANRSPLALYQMDSVRDGTVNAIVNQMTDGGKWNLLGRVRLRQGTGNVKLQAYSGNGVVVADAIRVVGPF